MIRSLYCVMCGGPRTVDTERLHRSGGAPLTCFRCGGTVFAASAAGLPYVPGLWCLTPRDRQFLQELRIACAEVWR